MTLSTNMAGVLDDLRTPARARGVNGYDPANGVCLRCQRPFASDWRGHRICSACAPLMRDAPYSPRPQAGPPRGR